MRYLLVLLLVGGLTGDKPQVNIQDPKPLPYPDATFSGPGKIDYDCTKFFGRMRDLKCAGLSVFDVATKLIEEGYCDPYTGGDCGFDVQGRRDTIGFLSRTTEQVIEGRSVVRRLEDGGKGRIRLPDRTISRTIKAPITDFAADTTIVDSLFESCWNNFIRYMGVKNWRRISPDGPYPPFVQPGILNPISNLVFVPNSRWENQFKCATSEGKPRVRDYAGRKRRYLGTEGFILEEKRGKGEDQKYQDIIDYIDSKIAEMDGGTAEQDIQSQMRTSYQTTTGLIDNQGTYRQGAHSSNDTVTLVAGEATIDISTAVTPGRMDQSFLSAQSYGGYAYTLDTTNAATYRLVPISGRRFTIISSDSTDTATVHFKVEGD